MKISAIIPVREKSQRVKNKNFRKFHKKNLLVYKIQQLKRIKGIDEIVVNTDSEEAIKIAKKLNVNYWKREKYYASSKCSNSEFWRNIAETTRNEFILFTNCTTPLIKDETYKKALKLFRKNFGKFDSLNSATLVKEFLYYGKKPLNFNLSKTPNSQNLPDILKFNFGINILSTKSMKTKKSVIGTKPFLLKIDQLEGIDIDTMVDFKFAEFLFKNSNHKIIKKIKKIK